ncbi:MAG: helix-turn-helix domain-containing protein [Acholeplasmataceae bacterium]|nr:helix-turn-helix domain-containing protein [Acholeplasmataceae bacterium]
MNNLHNNLKTMRNKVGYTQQEVADQLFVTRQCISRWEQGKTIPDIHSLEKISDIYECKLEDLLDNDCLRTFTLENANKTSKNKKNNYIFMSISILTIIISLTISLIAIKRANEEIIYSFQGVITNVDEVDKTIVVKDRGQTIYTFALDEFDQVEIVSRGSESLINKEDLKLNDTIEIYFDKEPKSNRIKRIRVLDSEIEDSFLGIIIISNGETYNQVDELPIDLQGIRYYYEDDWDFNTNFKFSDINGNYFEETDEKTVDLNLFYDAMKINHPIKIGLIYESGIDYIQTITNVSVQSYEYTHQHNYSDNYLDVHSYELNIKVTLNPVSSFESIELFEYDFNHLLINNTTYTDYLDLKLDHEIISNVIYSYVKINSLKENQFGVPYAYVNTFQVFIGGMFDISSSDDYGFVYHETIYYD